MTDKNNESPTVKLGEPGYYEDWILGNRSGFSVLRDTIDEMLKDESDTLMPDNCDSDFMGLSMSPISDTSEEESKSNWLLSTGCLLVIVSILGTLGLGIWKLIELLLN